MTQSKLKRIMHYNPFTGIFTWKVKPYRKGNIGTEVGGYDAYGYRRVTLNKKTYKIHRLAFLYMTGSMPVLPIDHINRKPDDNRWSNIREVSHSLNAHNKRNPKVKRRHNLPLGVISRRDCCSYFAVIKIKQKLKTIGRYPTKKLAAKAYKDFKKQFLPNQQTK